MNTLTIPPKEIKPLVLPDNISAAPLYQLKDWRSTLDTYPPNNDRVELTRQLLNDEITRREPQSRKFADTVIATLRQASAPPAPEFKREPLRVKGAVNA